MTPHRRGSQTIRPARRSAALRRVPRYPRACSITCQCQAPTAIPDRWLAELELRSEIERLAADLAVEGLTGAHIREVCYGATIRCETDALPYLEALRVELERMTDQHRQSRDYERAIRGGALVGFTAG